VPFLRVLRDKRGYETTYLVHWFRDGNRQRSRIIYVFRTPPGVRVGREVLDPDVVREIEQSHPGIEFDWRALLEHRQVIEHAGEPRRQRGKKKGTPAAAVPETVPSPPPPRVPVPEQIEGDTRDLQLAFLARWYPELRDRVPQRTQDPIRRQTLMALVERLNAAGWETDEQVAAGLQSAAEALQRLARVFSKRRRRAKRTKAPDVPDRPAAAAAPPDSTSPPDPTDAERSSADEPA
jgi:hypothetical protein